MNRVLANEGAHIRTVSLCPCIGRGQHFDRAVLVAADVVGTGIQCGIQAEPWTATRTNPNAGSWPCVNYGSSRLREAT